MKESLLATWCYRGFVISSIRTELRAKFTRSKLGGLWMILHPLSQVLIFAFVFSSLLSAKLPGIASPHAYAIYLLAGTLAWALFTEIVNRCLTLFIDNAPLLRKVSFPKITLPLIAMGGALVHNAFLFAATLFVFGLLGHVPGAAILWLPVLMGVTVALAFGLGVILGVLNVFMRDIGQVVPVALQFCFWLTPIVYVESIIPPQYRGWLVLNPLAPVVKGYQNILLYNRPPEWGGLGVTLVVTLVLFAVSLVLFRKASPDMVDQL